MKKRIVLDTNCLISSLSRTSDSYDVLDCAIAANATFIVSNDNHYKPLRMIANPKLSVIKLMEFVEILRSGL